MNSESSDPNSISNSGPSAPRADLDRLESRLANLEHALLENDGSEESLGSRIENLAAGTENDDRRPAEKLSEVADIARECAKAIDQVERKVVEVEEGDDPRRQQLLADRVNELREQVYQALRSIQESRQNEAQQELVATLTSLLDSNQNPLPGPSVN